VWLLPARKAQHLECSSELQLIMNVNDLVEEQNQQTVGWRQMGLWISQSQTRKFTPQKKKEKHKTCSQKTKSSQAATAVSDVNFMRPTGLPNHHLLPSHSVPYFTLVLVIFPFRHANYHTACT